MIWGCNEQELTDELAAATLLADTVALSVKAPPVNTPSQLVPSLLAAPHLGRFFREGFSRGALDALAHKGHRGLAARDEGLARI